MRGKDDRSMRLLQQIRLPGKQVKSVRIDNAWNADFIQSTSEYPFRSFSCAESASDADHIRPVQKADELIFIIFLIAGNDCLRQKLLQDSAVLLRRVYLHQTGSHCICSFCGEICGACHSAASCDHEYFAIAAFV